jgi:glycosyltransferase involved in cell wall biosynthesis
MIADAARNHAIGAAEIAVRPGQKNCRPRIGIYEPSAATSGPSRYVESILSGIDSNEFEVILFCRSSGPYQAHNKIEEIASPAVLCRTGRSRLAIPDWAKLWSGFGREALRLSRCFRRQPVDLLHTNHAGCEESAVAARIAGVPRVLGTFHVDSTYDIARTRSGLRHRVLEVVSNHCLHAAIAVSDATGRDWIRRTRLSPRRVTTIHNGIDPENDAAPQDQAAARRQLGLPLGDAQIIGGVGRLDAVKGFDVLLEAIALLRPQHPNLTLALAGDGPVRHALQQQAARLGIADRVHFLGFCKDVRQVYAALDIFAMPSRCEALPYALLEAMTAQLPAVASRIGGVPEVILPGQTGLLIPVGDSHALAAALASLLINRDLRQQMGRAARERIIHYFSEREMIAQTLALYRRLLNRPGAQTLRRAG